MVRSDGHVEPEGTAQVIIRDRDAQTEKVEYMNTDGTDSVLNVFEGQKIYFIELGRCLVYTDNERTVAFLNRNAVVHSKELENIPEDPEELVTLLNKVFSIDSLIVDKVFTS